MAKPWGLFDQPAPGKTDTSAEAAEAIAPKAPRLRHAINELIRVAPSGLTTSELACMTTAGLLAVRPRCTELRQAGMIIDTGKRRPNLNGRNEIVWASA